MFASVGNKCRLCGVDTVNDLRTIIFAGDEWRRNLYSTKIYECLSLQVLEGDHLPKVMCVDCTYKLDMLSEFRQNTKVTETLLLSSVFTSSFFHQKQPASQVDIIQSKLDNNQQSPLQHEKQSTEQPLPTVADDVSKRPFPNEMVVNTKQVDERPLLNNKKLAAYETTEPKAAATATFLPLAVPPDRKHREAGVKRLMIGLPVFQCRHCDALFNEKALVRLHIAEQHKKPRPPSTTATRVLCCVCNNWCISREALRVHLQLHIGSAELPVAHAQTAGTTTDTCAICQLKSTGPEHAHQHEQRPDLECGECRQMAPTREMANKHALMHADVDAPFFCSVCRLNFRLRRLANDHLKRYHDDDGSVRVRPEVEGEDQVVEPPPTTKAPPPTLPPPKTPHSKHSRSKPPTVTKKNPTKSRSSTSPPPPKRRGLAKRTCPACRRQMAADLVAAHVLRSHAGHPLCHLCLCTLPSVAQLEQHFAQAHIGQVVKCTQCDQFQDAEGGGMQEHMRVAHAHNRPYACPNCPRRFLATPQLRAHYRETHDVTSDAKVVACVWCGVEFDGVWVLAEHVDNTEACSCFRNAVKK